MDLDAARAAALQGHDAEEARRLEREREQAELDAEMERRRKRIEAWQEQRRRLQEAEEEAGPSEAPAGEQKAWTLEDEGSDSDGEGGEDEAEAEAEAGPGAGGEAAAAATAPPEGPPQRQQSDEEEDPLEAFMAANDRSLAAPAKPKQTAAQTRLAAARAAQQRQQQVAMEVDGPAAAAAAGAQDDEVDPLDAFMQVNVLPAVKQQALGEPMVAEEAEAEVGEATSKPAPPVKRGARQRRPRGPYDTSSSEDEGSDEEEEEAGEEVEEDDAEWARKLQQGKLSKGDKLAAVDHASVAYAPFRYARRTRGCCAPAKSCGGAGCCAPTCSAPSPQGWPSCAAQPRRWRAGGCARARTAAACTITLLSPAQHLQAQLLHRGA